MSRIFTPPYRYPAGRMAGMAENWIVHAYDTDIDATVEQVSTFATYAQLAAADTVQFDSSDAGDTTQTGYIIGVDSSGNRQSESVSLNGTTAVDSANTYTYIENVYVSAECAGTLTMQRKTGSTKINDIAVGFLSADVAQHFTCEAHCYLTQWWAELHGTTGQDDMQVELRWYPDDADCLDAGDGYHVVDRIGLHAGTANIIGADGFRVFKPALAFPPGGWLTIWAIAAAANMDVQVGMQGIDVIPTRT